MRAVLDGEDAIKGTTGEFSPTEFLPRLTPHDETRYAALIVRATFLEITSWTHQGMVGAVFRKPIPQLDIPDAISYVMENADGSGLGFDQLARQVVSEDLAVGRVGVLVDYSGSQAFAKIYLAENVIDVAETVERGVVKITQVRLREVTSAVDSDFVSREITRYRFLGIDENGSYYQAVYDADDNLIQGPIFPLDYNGKTFDFIPFSVIGAENNRAKIDKPPLLGIAWLNLAHYRNSADFEENLHIHGQGTLLLWSDMSFDQFKTANPTGINVGARAGHFLGSNGGGQLLQLNASSASREAMQDKVLQMIGIGARYLQDGNGRQETVDSVRIHEAQRSSGLAALVGNCESGLKNCLRWMCLFMGANPDLVQLRLNRDFYDRSLSAQEAQVLLLLKDGGAMAFSDILQRLKLAGWIAGDRTAEQIQAEIAQDGI